MKSPIEGIFPLTSTQEALLLRCIGRHDDDPGFAQVVLEIRGKVDHRLLREAWMKVVEAHAALRTSIHWEEVDEPVQVVRSLSNPALTVVEATEGVRIEDLLESDRSKGFDLGIPPLARLTLVCASDLEHRLVISTHHLVADGWSTFIIIRDLFSAYDALSNGGGPMLLRSSFGSYVKWLKTTDADAAREFWSRHLDGVEDAVRIPNLASLTRVRGAIRLARASRAIPEDLHNRTRTYADENQVTVGTIILAAWALTLIESGGNVAVFGVAVSGRHSGIPEAENTVGLLSSTIPFKISVAAMPVGDWLRSIQREFQSASSYSYLPISDITNCISHDMAGQPFDTVVAVQNFPVSSFGTNDFEVVSRSGDIVTVIPLTITTAPASREVECQFDCGSISPSEADQILQRFLNHIEYLVGGNADLGRFARRERAARPKVTNFAESDSNEQPSTMVSPANEIESRLAHLWEKTLRLRTISTKANFFDLGGTSLQAVRLARAVENEFGIAATPISIARYPTIRLYASELLKGRLDSFANLVELKSGDPHLPALFTLQPPIMFADFARRYSGRRAILNVRGFHFDTEGERLETYEEMAENAIHAMTAKQPSGPYHILFKCAGALPYEVARQLLEKGHAVGAVIVVDPGWIYPERRYGDPDNNGILGRLRNGRIDADRIIGYVTGHARKRMRKAAAAVKRRRHYKELGERGRQAVRAGRTASQRYAPVKSDIELSFILTREWRDREDLDSRIRRWEMVAERGVRIVDFGHDHHTVLGGNSANSFAECVEEILREHEGQFIAP
ncbi:MAG: hypothetical protein KJO98_07975 [Rhodothermia bacterium]|nr:hypothetical protein [Rhodothermia bacterium]